MTKWLVLLAAVATPISATAKQTMLPPQLVDKAALSIDDLDEPEFWSEAQSEHYTDRYRLSIVGIRCQSYLIRIDRQANGRSRGVVKDWDHCKRNAPYQERAFSLSIAATIKLQEAFKTANIWKTLYRSWDREDGKTICIDGEELSFEHRDTRGYHLEEANAQCTAPQSLLVAADAIIGLAKEKPALDLLR